MRGFVEPMSEGKDVIMQVRDGMGGSRMSELGNGPRHLKKARAKARMTQEQLANGAAVHVRTVRNLESGRIMRPRRATLEALASILGMSQVERDDLLAQWWPVFDPALPVAELVNSTNAEFNELARSAMTSATILALSETVRVGTYRQIESWETQEVIEARVDDLRHRTIVYQPQDARVNLHMLHLRDLQNCVLGGDKVFHDLGVKVFRLHLCRSMARGEGHLLSYRADFAAAYGGRDLSADPPEVLEAVGGFLRPPRSYVLEVAFADGVVPGRLIEIFQPAMDAPIRELRALEPDSARSVHIGLVEPRPGAHGVRWQW